ncbi:MAG: MBL fold metallo-hydrolase [Bacteroidetes bacterium]|nr:MBL fold metallo-hydrolase [Bacteroidota bacterium]
MRFHPRGIVSLTLDMNISRRSFLTKSAMLAMISSLPTPLRGLGAGFQPNNFTPIRRGVGIYESRGGTIGWLVRPEALVVVDSQYPESAITCREGLREKSGRSLDFLINTHHHGDHTAGNAVLGADATHILAHANVPTLQKRAAERNNTLDAQKYADVTFEEVWEESVGDENIRLSYFGPGHTSGDSIIHFQEADVVHMGDLVFNHSHAFIDLASGADTRNWIALLERAYKEFSDDTIFIFGHGNPTYGILGTREDLLATADYFTALRQTVSDGIRDGKTSDEIAEGGLDGFDSFKVNGSGTGIANNLKTVYEEVTRTVE